MKRLKDKKLLIRIVVPGLILLGVTVVVPLLIACLMWLTDVLYAKKGWTLSPEGIGNREWFTFWGSFFNSIIVFIGVLFVWISDRKYRQQQRNIELKQVYQGKTDKELQALMHVCKSMDASLAYKVVNVVKLNDLFEQRHLVNAVRDDLLNAKLELELLTDISVPLEQCNNTECGCYKIVKATRDTYYGLEKDYMELLNEMDLYIRHSIDKAETYNYITSLKDCICKRREQIKQYQCLIVQSYVDWATRIKMQDNISDLEKEIVSDELNVEKSNNKMIDLEKKISASSEKIVILSKKIENEKPNLINNCRYYYKYKEGQVKEIIDTGDISIKCRFM